MLILRLINLHTNQLEQVAWSETLADMVKFIEGEVSIVPYVDGIVTKTYKMGSVLENYSATDHPLLERHGVPAIDDVGTLEDWIKGTVANYNQTRELLHEAKSGGHDEDNGNAS